MIENENIKKAEEELEYLTGDEETRRIAELREKAIRDERFALNQARSEGREERNRATALRNGNEQGRHSREVEIAKKMLKNNIPVDLIMNCTGLTKEEIEKLK